MLTGPPFKLIRLTRGHKAIKVCPSTVYAAVSPEDYDELRRSTWYLKCQVWGTLYANANVVKDGKYTTITMHRAILNKMYPNLPKRLNTDHRNGYTLDNRRANLRPFTPWQNTKNQYPFSEIDTDPYPSPFAPPTGPFQATPAPQTQDRHGDSSHAHSAPD